MTRTQMINTIIGEVIARGGGVAHFDEFRQAGVSSRSLIVRIQRGTLHRVAHGVYATTAPDDLTFETRARALLRHAHDKNAALSHSTVPALLGAWPRERRGAPRIITTHNIHRSVTPIGTIHRTRSLPRHHLRVIRGVLGTTAATAVVDLAAHLHTPKLTAVIRECTLRGVLDLEALAEVMDDRPGARRIRLVHVALAMRRGGSVGTRNDSEDLFWHQLLRIGAPLPLVNVRGATGHPLIECDFVWHDRHLVIEVDGPHHNEPDQRRIDEIRDAILRADGWRAEQIRSLAV